MITVGSTCRGKLFVSLKPLTSGTNCVPNHSSVLFSGPYSTLAETLCLDFPDLPITIRGNLYVPTALLHTKTVTHSLLILKVCFLFFLEARLFFGSAFLGQTSQHYTLPGANSFLLQPNQQIHLRTLPLQQIGRQSFTSNR